MGNKLIHFSVRSAFKIKLNDEKSLLYEPSLGSSSAKVKEASACVLRTRQPASHREERGGSLLPGQL